MLQTIQGGIFSAKGAGKRRFGFRSSGDKMSANTMGTLLQRRFRPHRVPLVTLLGIAWLISSLLPCSAQSIVPRTDQCVAVSPNVALELPNAEPGLKQIPDGAQVKLTIIAFLETYPDTAHSESHAQAAVLMSMENQYGKFGLRMRIVDVSSDFQLSPTADSDLINVPYDWHLKPAEFLVDRTGIAEKHYCVRHAPAVLIYDQKGTLIKRWNGPVRSAALGMTIHQLLRLPFDKPTQDFKSQRRLQ